MIVLLYYAAVKLHVVHQDDAGCATLSCISQLLCIENLYLTLSISFGSLNCTTGPVACACYENRIYSSIIDVTLHCAKQIANLTSLFNAKYSVTSAKSYFTKERAANVEIGYVLQRQILIHAQLLGNTYNILILAFVYYYIQLGKSAGTNLSKDSARSTILYRYIFDLCITCSILGQKNTVYILVLCSSNILKGNSAYGSTLCISVEILIMASREKSSLATLQRNASAFVPSLYSRM